MTVSPPLDDLVAIATPTFVGAYGAGTDTAGQLLVTAGDTPDRLESEAACADLCTTAPLPATSRKQTTRPTVRPAGSGTTTTD